ncbi:hypothetical protein PENTCL1PPCAC_26100, partial [Pristionchus entomophagus]
RASAEKDALIAEHRKREMEIIKTKEEKQDRERMEAAARLDLLNATYNQTIEDKNKEVIKTKEEMHNEKITMMEANEKEKSKLQKAHQNSLNEQQEKFLEQQDLAQEKFQNEV